MVMPPLPVRSDGSFMDALSDLFGYLSRVFNDPDVKAAGNRFFAAIETAGERELPGAEVLALTTTYDPCLEGRHSDCIYDVGLEYGACNCACHLDIEGGTDDGRS